MAMQETQCVKKSLNLQVVKPQQILQEEGHIQFVYIPGISCRAYADNHSKI